MSITAMKEAVEALKPFTEDADGIHEGWANERQRSSLSQKKPITVGDVRRAKLATEKLNTAIAETEACEQVDWKKCLNEAKMVYSDYLDVQEALHYLEQVFLAAGAQPAPKQEPIPPGYQLVPVEPTDKMVQASLHLDLSYMPLQEGYDRAAVYKAMLAAAPVQAQEQRKPLFKEFLGWAGKQGYDCANTCNSDTGEWICLNPMTSDLWKAWQAAHNIKEQS